MVIILRKSTKKNETIVDLISSTLSSEIISGRLVPGTELKELEISERFGCSRTPVREAFRQLASDNLIETKLRRGASVTQRSIRDIVESYQIREQLEPYSCRIAAENLTDDELDEMEKLLNTRLGNNPTLEETERYLNVDRQFHDMIIESTNNQVLRRIMHNLLAHTIRMFLSANAIKHDKSVEEREKIIIALRQRDPIAAEQAMREHLIKARARLIE